MIFVLMTDCRSPSSDTHTAQQQFQCIPSQLLLSQRQQPFGRPRRHHLSIAEFLHNTAPCSCPACTEDSTHTRLPSSFLSSSKASGSPRTSAGDQDTVSSRRTTSHTSCGVGPWRWATGRFTSPESGRCLTSGIYGFDSRPGNSGPPRRSFGSAGTARGGSGPPGPRG